MGSCLKLFTLFLMVARLVAADQLYMKEDVDLGDSVWNANSVQTMEILEGNDVVPPKATEGKFVLVGYFVTNKENGDKTAIQEPKLLDGAGRSYGVIPNMDMYLRTKLGTWTGISAQQIAPGLKRLYAAIYEVPKDASDLKLLAHSLNLGLTTKPINLRIAPSVQEERDQQILSKIKADLDEIRKRTGSKNPSCVDDVFGNVQFSRFFYDTNNILNNYSITVDCDQNGNVRYDNSAVSKVYFYKNLAMDGVFLSCLERNMPFMGNARTSIEIESLFLKQVQKNYDKFLKWSSLAQENKPSQFIKLFDGTTVQRWDDLTEKLQRQLFDEPEDNRSGGTFSGEDSSIVVGRGTEPQEIRPHHNHTNRADIACAFSWDGSTPKFAKVTSSSVTLYTRQDIDNFLYISRLLQEIEPLAPKQQRYENNRGIREQKKVDSLFQ